MKILVVDDEKTLVKGIKFNLENEGYQVECGYDDVAKIIAQYEEVDTVQLMSGSFDLAVIIKGTNLRDVALFVSDRLATLDGVLSTTTHFILQRYKEKGVNFAGEEADERSLVSP